MDSNPRVERAAARRLRILGAAAVLGFGVHAAVYAQSFHWSEALWACHVAFLVLGVGLLLASPAIAGIGAFCLLLGTPAWLIHLLHGLELAPTSLLTHGGGFLLALYSLYALGVPRRVWLTAPCFLAGLQLFSRFATPRERNINAAFAVYEPLAPYFANYLTYELTLLTVTAGVFLLLETALRTFAAAHSKRAIARAAVADSTESRGEPQRGGPHGDAP